MKKKIIMVVTNEVITDNRVKKEAQSLSKNYSVLVLGFLRNDVKVREKVDNYKILRIKEPILRRLFVKSKLFKSLFTVESNQGLNNKKVQRLSFMDYVGDFLQIMFLLNKSFTVFKKLTMMKADIYHANDLDTLVPCVLAAKKYGGKVIYDSHELCTEEGWVKSIFFKNMMVSIENRYINMCDDVITVNKSIAYELKNRYNLVNKPNVILNTPIQQKINEKPDKKPELMIKKQILKKNKKCLSVLFTGFLAPDRGLEEMVDALEHVNGVHFYIRGFGTIVESLKDRIKKLGISKKVTFLPVVSPDKLIKLSSKYDVGIIFYRKTTLNHLYCTPNKLFEFMMSGLCILANDLPELKRFITQCKSGMVINSEKRDEIKQALEFLRDNPNKLNEFKKNSFKSGKLYTWKAEEKKLLKIYDKLNK
jgi:glycosyltransferase involved in cell wall biosynthesis